LLIARRGKDPAGPGFAPVLMLYIMYNMAQRLPAGMRRERFSHRVPSRAPSSRPESLFSLPIPQHRPRVTGVLRMGKALSALLFLHRQVLGCDVGDAEGVTRTRRSGGGSGPSPGNEVEEQEDGRTGAATASAAHLTAGRAFLYCPDIHQTRCRAGGSIALSAGDGGLVSRCGFVDTQTAGCCPGRVMQSG